jgi:2-haloacid dehalogenase
MTWDITRFHALTFDCYGTLIDWETGILNTVRPLLEAHGVRLSDATLLEDYAEFESAAEASAFQPYREILRGVVRAYGAKYGFTPTQAEQNLLPDSLGQWLPFPDTVAALQTLAERYSLNIVSNVDDDLFAQTATHLNVRFQNVVTALQVQSYKPSPRHFEEMLRRLALPAEAVLHVAQSLYHDIAPARAMGMATVWINRRAGRAGAGATPPAEVVPDLELPDLRSLAQRVCNA